MVRFITKKDRNGKNRHIPSGSTGQRRRDPYGYSNVAQATLKVGPPARSGMEEGDQEYTGLCMSPAMGLEAVRRHAVEKELRSAYKETREEWFYYDLKGRSISEAAFYRRGGDFDLVARTPDGSKYQVNGSIVPTKLGPRWVISGIGSWITKNRTDIERGGEKNGI